MTPEQQEEIAKKETQLLKAKELFQKIKKLSLEVTELSSVLEDDAEEMLTQLP